MCDCKTEWPDYEVPQTPAPPGFPIPKADGTLQSEWCVFAEAYREAARKLLDTAKEEAGVEVVDPRDTPLVLSAVFLYRHFVELALKAILHESGRTVIATHGLARLWRASSQSVLAGLDELRHPRARATDIKKGIDEFVALDPHSIALRYPDGEPPRFNIPKLQRNMQIIGRFLMGIATGTRCDRKEREAMERNATMPDPAPARPEIAFLGLGQMGGPMVTNLVKAGYVVHAYDPVAEKLEARVSDGAAGAASAEEAVNAGEVVMTSLRSSAMFVEVAGSTLLPNARAGQVFIDMGTTEAPEARRLAAEFTKKGATFLDAPVSGGSASGMLRIFVGGDRAAFERCRPILDVIGDPERVVYCGPSGTGQAVKGANQLAMGLVSAAYLEAIAFGVLAGADPEAIMRGVGQEAGNGFRARVAEFARKVIAGSADDVFIKFPELQYYLREARERGFEMPLTKALFKFTDPGPRDWVDNMRRPRVAFWHMLTAGKL